VKRVLKSLCVCGALKQSPSALRCPLQKGGETSKKQRAFDFDVNGFPPF